LKRPEKNVLKNAGPCVRLECIGCFEDTRLYARKEHERRDFRGRGAAAVKVRADGSLLSSKLFAFLRAAYFFPFFFLFLVRRTRRAGFRKEKTPPVRFMA